MPYEPKSNDVRLVPAKVSATIVSTPFPKAMLSMWRQSLKRPAPVSVELIVIFLTFVPWKIWLPVKGAPGIVTDVLVSLKVEFLNAPQPM